MDIILWKQGSTFWPWHILTLTQIARVTEVPIEQYHHVIFMTGVPGFMIDLTKYKQVSLACPFCYSTIVTSSSVCRWCCWAANYDGQVDHSENGFMVCAIIWSIDIFHEQSCPAPLAPLLLASLPPPPPLLHLHLLLLLHLLSESLCPPFNSPWHPCLPPSRCLLLLSLCLQGGASAHKGKCVCGWVNGVGCW